MSAMVEKRAASRRRVLKSAFIVIGERAPKIACTVKNVSAKGASLQLQTTVGIPGNFELINDGARRRCRSAWRTDSKIAVVFE